MVLTYDEWLRTPDPACGTDEIVGGELRLIPVRLHPHAQVIANFLHFFLNAPDDVRAYGSGIGVMISREPVTCRSPDIAVFRRGEMVVRDGLFWSSWNAFRSSPTELCSLHNFRG